MSKKEQVSKHLQIGGHDYFRLTNKPLGKCEDCKADAFSYDELGRLLCDDCLQEHHLMGDYDNDEDL